MHPRPIRRRLRGRLAALLFAWAPLAAFAADPALSAWSVHFLFAVVATVVIVLLLHEALDDERGERMARRDASAGDGFASARASGRAGARHVSNERGHPPCRVTPR